MECKWFSEHHYRCCGYPLTDAKYETLKKEFLELSINENEEDRKRFNELYELLY